ncbi:MAG: hypothetical protein KC917_01055 [Candidatus Omnitrophica bacterium]|nr:hypothetical protein [Candidatus Omnitrophota bacterium]MCA9414819.1 hypothetical protein [Candidatus Omnitrophota bacterium]MCA9434180.1 hypothetical protein [Candidatus Omnitrophota bacterium]MCA9443793.1 hypothetical protein [Candidatus Omnitrophota bacterium]MCB9767279.1 hypothetical protein [Candidatus Omnitrophota bacterium]
MNEPISPTESEITLAGLVRVAAGSWKPLLAVGIVAGVLAGIVLEMIPAKYEASSTILVTRTRAKDEMVGLDTTAIELDSFAAALESEEILEDILEQFNLGAAPYEFDIEEFDDAVSITPLRNENSLRISVELPALEDGTPKLVADLANAFAMQADSISRRLLEEDIERSLSFYRSQYQESEDRLNQIRDETIRVKASAPIEEKTRFITNQEMLQRQLQTSWALALADLEQKEEKQKVLGQIVAEEEPVLTVTRLLEEEPAMLDVVAARTGRSATELYSATSSSQIINDVYTNVRRIYDEISGDVAGLRRAVEELPKEIEECTRRIAEAEEILNASQVMVDHYDNLLETAHLGFRDVYKKFELAKIAIASDRQDLIGEWIRAFPPQKVSGAPTPVLIVTSALLAMLLFLVILFFIEVIRVSLKS